MARSNKAELVYYLYRLGSVVLPRVPARMGYALCDAIAAVAWHLGNGVRANIQHNLRQILGDSVSRAELVRRSRATVRYLTYNYFDLFRLPRLSDAEVGRLVHIEGWEHVEAALAEGRGVVMTSAHYGNIEIVLYAMLLRGVDIVIPVERIDPPQLFEFVTTLRMSKGLRLIPIDGPLLEMYRTLRRGGVVGVAADRDITASGSPTSFFGAQTPMPDGHIRLALRTGAPLVLGFSRRRPDFTYHAYFLPPYHLPRQGSTEERVAAGMRYVIRNLEQAIAAAPEQWTITTPIWAEN